MVLSFLHGLCLSVGTLVLLTLVLVAMPFVYVLLIAILVALISNFVRLGRHSEPEVVDTIERHFH